MYDRSAQASVVLVEKREQSDILLAHRHAFPSLRHIILVEGPAPSYPPSCAFMWRQVLHLLPYSVPLFARKNNKQTNKPSSCSEEHKPVVKKAENLIVG